MTLISEASSSVAVPVPARAPLRDDVIRLPGGRWFIWPYAALRGAGFPATDVLQLSSPLCARLARDVSLARAHRPGAQAAGAPRGSGPARAALRAALAGEMRRIRAVLRAHAADPAFAEAVLWQNHRAFTYGIKLLTGSSNDRVDRDARRAELLIASYLQRYCVKNDIIGFYGPMGWVRFGQGRDTIALTCGAGLVETRSAYFEGWCVDALARTYDEDSSLQPWSVPRHRSFVRLDGARLMVGARMAEELSPEHHDLFAACQGERHAQAIAHDVRARWGTAFPSEGAVYDLLERWCRAGYLLWTFEGPRELRPERRLRERLDRIDDPVLRQRSLAKLDRLEACAGAVREATGNVAALVRAIEDLEETFTTVTGVASARRGGQTYAARTLMYEECRRDVLVGFGPELVDRLGPPLSLVLESLRWALHEVARRELDEFRRAFDDLGGASRRPVSLGLFLSKLSLLVTPRGALSKNGAAVQAELQQRWQSILCPPPGARRIQYRGALLRKLVDAVFATPDDPPYAWARTLSPDVMIDAASVEAIRRGEYQLVLGEVHAVNTMQTPPFMDQHPEPEEMLRSLDLDYPAPRVVWIESKEVAPHRVHFATRPRDFAYMTNSDPSPVPPERTLRTADLEVADEAGALVVRTRDRRHRFPVLDFFGGLITHCVINVFDLLPPMPCRPRVTIDDVVVCREGWEIPANEIAFAGLGDDVDRFVECQRWASRHGLPQFVFVKVPTERKPSYVDLASPVYVALFAKWVRNVQEAQPTGVIALSEMLPVHTHTWLVDAAGRHYTSELRIVAVDPRAARVDQAARLAVPPAS